MTSTLKFYVYVLPRRSGKRTAQAVVYAMITWCGILCAQ